MKRSNINSIKKSFHSELEIDVGKRMIYIDTCSLLYINAPMFWEHIIPILQAKNKKIYTLGCCISELKKLSKSEDTKLAQNAIKTLSQIEGHIKDGYLFVEGEETDKHADNVFISLLNEKRIDHYLLLITQDRKLAHDILCLNYFQSSVGWRISVKHINKYEYLGSLGICITNQTNNSNSINDHRKDINHGANNTRVFPISERSGKVIKSSVYHSHSTIIEELEDTLDTDCMIPHELDSIDQKTDLFIENSVFSYDYFCEGKSLILSDCIALDDEGAIFSLEDSNDIVKIFGNELIRKQQEEEIDLIISKEIGCSGVCMPKKVVVNEENQFVGYVMKRAEGESLQSLLSKIYTDKYQE